MSKVVEFPRSENFYLEEALRLFKTETADLALAKCLELINKGYDGAYSFVGDLYLCGGRNLKCDYEKAKLYYEESMERTGSAGAYLGLIKIYYYGLGVEYDYCKAFEYCRILVDEISNPHACFYMGKMYMEGHCVDVDIEKAKVFFKMSWEQGYVFGLTYLGFAEQRSGRPLRGWACRIRAAISAYKIARRDLSDPRIREL